MVTFFFESIFNVILSSSHLDKLPPLQLNQCNLGDDSCSDVDRSPLSLQHSRRLQHMGIVVTCALAASVDGRYLQWQVKHTEDNQPSS